VTRPPTVAVKDDADVPRHLARGQRSGETPLVEPVQEVRQAHARISFEHDRGDVTLTLPAPAATGERSDGTTYLAGVTYGDDG